MELLMRLVQIVLCRAARATLVLLPTGEMLQGGATN